MDRRKFVTTAGLAGTAGLLAACGNRSESAADCPETSESRPAETFEWKMVTTWPRDFPGLGTGANYLARIIGEMSDGRLTVKVYGGNELVPPFEVFDAVQRGTAEMGHGGAYYWKGKIPASPFFSGVPFGLTGAEMNGWFYHGGGLEVYRETYAPFGVIPWPIGNSGTQMGGWFNKEINSVDDLKGLKMRIPGFGGEVLKAVGGTPVNIPGAELFTALQNGTIDATEWVGPMNDLAFGLFRAAQYYYYPGWHEPGTALEGIVNAEAYEALPADLQAIVKYACQAANMDMFADFEARNGEALQTLIREHGVELRPFPEDVLAELREAAFEVVEAQAASDEMSAKVWGSLKTYMENVKGATAVGAQAFVDRR
ncbi:MAG: TRAP transporter substrate-binding protein [Xanthomonadales bacterium]|nr:TRAP transporter substrate-binding protein [Gammaproteobacteria bacterium]MBT8065269.1 TRAP transporter substrate-binding protein [Gammaproteobacteria bacterium]NNK32192.1 TRAP transporter substrate-binding protein [Xanthomonadales bacterium]NNK37397.1 TRAP transporter substrate-binding protein [Xanthomonadales bacterium]